MAKEFTGSWCFCIILLIIGIIPGVIYFYMCYNEVGQAGQQQQQQVVIVNAGVPQTKGIFCNNCGAKITGTEKFCSECGKQC